MHVHGQAGPRLLSYCTNVHAAETVSEIESALGRFAVPLKHRFCPDEPMGLGLRLGELATQQLATDEGTFQDFAAFLSDAELFVYTVNAFPQGDFHADVVKEEVYRPSWAEKTRVRYTLAAARVLARLLPASVTHGTLSTVPLGFGPEVADSMEVCATNLIHVADALATLEMETGQCIQVCLEPEPLCVIETISEVIAFFKDHLFARAAELPARNGLTPLELIKRHLGVCYDACHQAVEFDEPAYDFERLAGAGIDVGKVQLSCALELKRPRENPEGLLRLRQFVEPRFLHQVVARDRSFRRHRFLDLDAFLDHVENGHDDFDIARCHFHVPIHLPDVFPLGTTQAQLLEVLHRLDHESVTHLEVETYTFSMLPADARTVSLLDDLEAELTFARNALI